MSADASPNSPVAQVAPLLRLDHRHFLAAAIVVAIALAGVAEPRFLSQANVVNLLTQAGLLAVFAYAQTFPLIGRGFDLSLGATVSLCSVTSAIAMSQLLAYGEPFAVAMGLACALLTGLVVGCVNGSLIAWAGLNPFVVTVGTWNIVDGIASTVTGGFPVPTPGLLNHWLSGLSLGPISIVVLLVAVVSGVVWLVLERSSAGRRLYLVGSNPSAAFFGGIANKRVTLTAYVACSCLAALGAAMLTARAGSGEPNLGGNLTLQSIAAAVIGGISLQGGEGRHYAPLLGALLLTLLSNALNFFGVDSYVQEIVLGGIIVASVSLGRLSQRSR